VRGALGLIFLALEVFLASNSPIAFFTTLAKKASTSLGLISERVFSDSSTASSTSSSTASSTYSTSSSISSPVALVSAGADFISSRISLRRSSVSIVIFSPMLE